MWRVEFVRILFLSLTTVLGNNSLCGRGLIDPCEISIYSVDRRW